MPVGEVVVVVQVLVLVQFIVKRLLCVHIARMEDHILDLVTILSLLTMLTHTTVMANKLVTLKINSAWKMPRIEILKLVFS